MRNVGISGRNLNNEQEKDNSESSCDCGYCFAGVRLVTVRGPMGSRQYATVHERPRVHRVRTIAERGDEGDERREGVLYRSQSNGHLA